MLSSELTVYRAGWSLSFWLIWSVVVLVADLKCLMIIGSKPTLSFADRLAIKVLLLGRSQGHNARARLLTLFYLRVSAFPELVLRDPSVRVRLPRVYSKADLHYA